MMRIAALAALLLAIPACRFDNSALTDVPSPEQDASPDSVPDSGLPDRIPTDTGRDTAKQDAGSDSFQDDAGQSDTLVQSDADVQSDGALQTDTLPQSDTLPQQDGPLVDPCVGLVGDYTNHAGIVDHCNDATGYNNPGHQVPLIGGKAYAPDGICRIICWTQPSENASILPDSCAGTWDVLVVGPSSWTSDGCQNVIPGAQPYIAGCNSDRRCEVPKYP